MIPHLAQNGNSFEDFSILPPKMIDKNRDISVKQHILYVQIMSQLLIQY